MTLATALPAGPSRCPASLTAAIRRAVRRRSDWGQTAQLVAQALGRELPGPDILTGPERDGDPGSYQTHVLHVEPDGSFSIVGVVWRPGQVTPIHDHVTWCVAGVLQGAEDEELFTLADGGTVLRRAGRNLTTAGSVTGFAPPGDIHLVRNPGPANTVSLHVYGADITRLGTSTRRVYQLPVQPG
jgi:3-mercaptopropionate dioxygenase